MPAKNSKFPSQNPKCHTHTQNLFLCECGIFTVTQLLNQEVKASVSNKSMTSNQPIPHHLFILQAIFSVYSPVICLVRSYNTLITVSLSQASSSRHHPIKRALS